MNPLLLLGGSFDPPHQGHLALADRAAEYHKVDSVTFVPNYVNPLKKESTSAYHRLKMLEIFLQGKHPILHYEIEKEGPSYTVETLRYLKESTGRDLVWLIGADCLENLEQWKDIKGIREMVRFQLFTRVGHELKGPSKYQSLIDQAIHLEMPYSSTEIRQNIWAGRCPQGLDEQVWSYIRDQGLYSNS